MANVALTCIGRVASDPRLPTMQQVFQQLQVMHIGGRCRNRMNDLGLAVDANIHLHTKIPLIPFLGLMHLRIARLFPVYGGARSIDDAGIQNSAAGDPQLLRLKVFANRLKQLLTQPIPFQQMPKVEIRHFIRHRGTSEINAHKAAYGT